MKIAYFGYDYFWNCLDSLLIEGHEVVKLFTYKTDNVYNFNSKVVDLVSESSIPVQFGKVTKQDVVNLKNEGCELIVSAAYPYKIPVIEGMKGINIHPTLLPEGKGPWPLPYVILNDLCESGVTIHKLSENFDSGEILVQNSFKVSKKDNLESISCKSQILAKNLLNEFMSNIESCWKNATAQGEGSYWPFPTDEQQTINWEDEVEVIDKTARAYGKLEAMASFSDKPWVVRDLTVWKQQHNYDVGSVVHETNKEVVIAASDGLVCLRFFDEDLDQ